MYINEECLRITDVKPLEYVSWCKTTKNKVNSRDSKRKFFELIREGRLLMYIKREPKNYSVQLKLQMKHFLMIC